MQSVSVIVVTFNSANTIEACLLSVPSDVEVVVVDQRSVDDTIARAALARPSARLIVSDRNRGFGAGCNLGAANSTGEVLIFLNPDAKVADDACNTLARALGLKGVGAVGPTILDLDGSDHTECRRRGTPVRDALNLTLPQRLIPSPLRQDLPPTDPVYVSGGAVPYVQGACIGVARGIFDEVGRFDDDFFLYSEEEWLADRLAARGLEIRLVPGAIIEHVGGASTRQVAQLSTRHRFRSRVVLYRKRYGDSRGLAGAAGLGVAVLALLVTASTRRRLDLRAQQDRDWCLSALRGVRAGTLARLS